MRSARTLLPLLTVGIMTTTAEGQQAPTLPYRVSAPPPAGLERERLQAEALQRLQELIRIDTQNPPGNERKTALYLDSIFRAAGGFETHVLDAGDGRANFIARLRAKKPSRKPVLVMGHMDVVGVQREKWSVDPFAGAVKDGYLYGRGAIDDKGMIATSVTAILH